MSKVDLGRDDAGRRVVTPDAKSIRILPDVIKPDVKEWRVSDVEVIICRGSAECERKLGHVYDPIDDDDSAIATDSGGVSESSGGTSTPITGISFATGTLRKDAAGTDLWPVTWGDNGKLYTTGGDGNGFDGAVYQHLTVSEVNGAPAVYTGADILSKSGVLPTGIISVGGDLYMIEQQRGDFDRIRIGKSVDYGLNWTYNGDPVTDWDIDEDDAAFSHSSFVQYGQDNASPRDSYVYVVSHHQIDTGVADRVNLMRIPAASIQNVATFEYFAGLDGNDDPTWTSTIADRAGILTASDAIHWGVRVNYNPVLNRYLLTTFSDEAGTLVVYDGAEPWGPWTKIHESTLIDTTRKFCLQFVNKTDWISADGLTWWAVFSGIGTYDYFCVIQATLVAGEPAFNAAIHTSLFYEDFESYADLNAMWAGDGDYNWNNYGDNLDKIALMPSGGVNGGQHLRFDYTEDPKSDEDPKNDYSMKCYPSANLEALTTGIDPLIITIWFKDTGTRHTKKRMEFYVDSSDGAYDTRRIMWSDDQVMTDGWDNEITVRQCWWGDPEWPWDPIDPIETPPKRWGNNWDINLVDAATSVMAVQPNVNYSEWSDSYANYNDGVWRRITWRITRQKNGAYGQGRIEEWWDGIKTTEYIGDDPGRCEYGKVHTTNSLIGAFIQNSLIWGQTTSGNPSSWSGGAYIYYDNLRIYTVT